MNKVNTAISVVSGMLVLFLAGSAFVLSFEALKDLAYQVGIAEQMAWLYPAIIDGAIIVFSLSVLRANLNRERTLYPWALVSLFTLLSVVLNIIHADENPLAQSLAAIPPLALFLSFELFLSQLKETAVRLEALNSLNQIVRRVRKKEAELNGIVRQHSETIEKLKREIGRLERRKVNLHSDIRQQSNGKTAEKVSSSDTIGRARRTRTAKKQEAMQKLLEHVKTNPDATLSKLAVEIGRPKSTVGGYVSELQKAGKLEKGKSGWQVREVHET